MIEGLKPYYNAAFRPLIKPLIKLGVTPNHITISGTALFGVAAWFAWQGWWKASTLLVILGSFLDGLDGVLARESNQKSVFGAILDSSCDRLTEIVLLLGVLGYLLSAPQISFSKEALSINERAWGVVFCFSAVTMSLMVSYVKARCEGAGVACNRGLLQRPERLILFGAGLFFGPHAMLWILCAVSVLSIITVVERLFQAHKEAKG
jgi:CDP-diacylglycerol---glycerol-3-phosphate 3-phosphatidyltransferase